MSLAHDALKDDSAFGGWGGGGGGSKTYNACYCDEFAVNHFNNCDMSPNGTLKNHA